MSDGQPGTPPGDNNVNGGYDAASRSISDPTTALATGEEATTRTITLDEFRILIGISIIARPPTSTSERSLFGGWLGYSKWNDVESNVGLYASVCHEEASSNRAFHLFNFSHNSCILLQLTISAVLIILGALPKDYHIPISVLGAVNGIITSILGLLKGQGLPNRLRQYRDELRKVRESIEWLERELLVGRTVHFDMVEKIKAMYQQVRQDSEKNHPDAWVTGIKGKIVSADAGVKTSFKAPGGKELKEA